MSDKKRSRVTLEQVAKHAGVSRATASLVVRGSPNISKETRKKVLQAMKELGYVYDRVAANLRSQRSSTVGLIITELDNPFFFFSNCSLASMRRSIRKDIRSF